MALIFIDGFDHYNIGDITAKWSTITGSIQWLMATGRFGGQCVQGNRYGGVATITKAFTGLTNFAIGIAVKFPSVQSGVNNFFTFLSGTGEQVSISMKADATMTFAYNGTALTSTNSGTYGPLTLGQWNYVEVLLSVGTSVAANSCKLYLNGNLYQTLNSGQNTDHQASGSVSAVSFRIDNAYDSSNPWYFDDFYLLTIDSDTTGVLGDCKIETLYPTGAGTNTQWTPHTGSNYAQVNEAHFDSDTSYVFSGTSGQIDTYTFGDLSSTPTTVHGVQSTIMVKKDATGTLQVEPTVYTGGTAYQGTPSTTLFTSYAAYTSIFRTNPATSSAWTGSAVNGVEFGFTVST